MKKPWEQDWEHDGKGAVWNKEALADLVHVPTDGHGQSTQEVLERGALIAAAPLLARELRHLVRLLEPLEKSGSLNVPGLATLNGVRLALREAGVPLEGESQPANEPQTGRQPREPGEHAWAARATEDGLERCMRRNCNVRRTATAWQRAKGGHWRRVAEEPIPPCAGK